MTKVPQSNWGFFRLPREIRDSIYYYTLYEPSGLHYRRTGPYTADFILQPGTNCPAFNQLQYTSQQLRAETLHLERTLNTLIFTQSITPEDQSKLTDDESSKTILKDPAVQLMGFLDTCDENARLRLRNLRLHYNHRLELTRCCQPLPIDAEHNGDLINVARFCEVYPNVTVWWHTRALEYLCIRTRMGSSVHHRVLLAGTIFARALRPNFDLDKVREELKINLNENLLHPWDHGVFHSCMCREDLCWYNHRPGYAQETCSFQTEGETYLKGTNFRLLPEVDEGWQEEMRRDSKERWGTEDELLERRVERTREYVTHGI